MIKQKKIYFLCFGLSIFLLTGCATKRPVGIPAGGIVVPSTEVSLKALCEKHRVQWQWDSVSQVIILKANHLEVKAMVGSNIVLIGEERIFLTTPIRIEKSLIVVPEDFYPKVMSRMVVSDGLRSDYTVSKIKHVLIDPGHGGKDPGALGFSGTKEKDIVLDIARELQDILSRWGFEVEMTREDDRFVTLEKRTEAASRVKTDFFISIHANSSPTSRATGVEVFSLRNLSVSELNSEQRKRNQYLLFRNFSMSPDSNVKSIVADILYDHKCFMDDLLVHYIVKNLSKHMRARDRGHKKSGFFVLKNTVIPAILVEVGFLSNPREEALLNQKSYRRKIARSLAEAILDYNRYSDDELCNRMERAF